MKEKCSDSLIPIGIGASFFSSLLIMLTLGAIAGFYLKDKLNFQQLGGVPLLFIFLVLLVGPLLYNKKGSRFEKGKKIVAKFDGIGTVQGLRGAFIRLLVYEEGIEIRAFYHRYYIPFNKIISTSIDEGYINKRLNIVTGIHGFPDYISSSGRQFLSLAVLIERMFKSCRANSVDAETRATV